MEASDHVESMDANYGGTEIYSALSSTFTIRRTDRHTSVFLLTDGDVSQFPCAVISFRPKAENFLS